MLQMFDAQGGVDAEEYEAAVTIQARAQLTRPN